MNPGDSKGYDPYHLWLGILPQEQPPNHYRLLGIDLFEADPVVISAAAEQRAAHVRTYQLGPYSTWSQKILNEIAAAKVCLLNPSAKLNYDEKLRGQVAPPAPLDPGRIASPANPLQSPGPPPLKPTAATLLSPAVGRLAIVVGLVLVLTARSCDSLGDRAVVRARAKIEALSRRIDQQWTGSESTPHGNQSGRGLSGRLREALEKKTAIRKEIEGTIDSPDDKDMYKFRVPVSGRMELQQTADFGLDSYLKLYDSKENVLAENDDSGSSRNARIQHDVTEGEMYFVSAGSVRATTGSYRLIIEICEPQDEDVGDVFTLARLLQFSPNEDLQSALRQWQALDLAAHETASRNGMNKYWFAWLFYVGSIVLSLGLLHVGFHGVAAERWICLATAAVVLFSIYVGGNGWPNPSIGESGQDAHYEPR